jgi:cyclic pyranopterin phosphate synthase
MPEEGVELSPSSSLMTADEIVRLTSLFASQGVDKVRLTGGEPLLRSDIINIISRISAIVGIKVISMTTNGITLSNKLTALKQAGLSSLNISLDTLISDKFEFISRRKGHSRVLKAIDNSLDVGFEPVKVNCVVMRGLNDDELCDFVQLTQMKPIDVRFIEYMPFDGNKWNTNKFLPYREMLSSIFKQYPNLTRVNDTENDTAKHYQVPGFRGRIGFITSMSEHFCNSCNRIRLTADGNLKVCLFGANEVSLKDYIRAGKNDEDLLPIISSAIKRKHPQHAGMLKLSNTKNRPMILIGGFHTLSRSHLMSSKMSTLSHVDSKGDPQMVDVTHKDTSLRTAVAKGSIKLSPKAMQLIKDPSLNRKGSVTAVARTAAVMAIKKTSDIIPLCHPLPIGGIDIDIELGEEDLTMNVSVSSMGKTGVEMEALTGVSVGLLTVYDMTKSVNYDHQITNIQLIKKSGGKSDFEKK